MKDDQIHRRTYTCIETSWISVCILPPRWHIWTAETIHYLQESWQDVLWCFLLYGTQTCWHFNIMVPIMHSSVHRLWTSSQQWCDVMWCHDMYLELLLDFWWGRLTFSICINRGLKKVQYRFITGLLRLYRHIFTFLWLALVYSLPPPSSSSFFAQHCSPSCSPFQSVINY